MDRGGGVLLRVITVLGATLGLTFSLLTAFLPGLAYGITVGITVFPYSGLFGPFRPQTHSSTIGMLVSGVGALLGLFSSLRGRHVRLGFAGVLLALSGFPLLRLPVLYYPHYYQPPLVMFWWGPGLTMLGIVMMFWSFVARSRVVPHLLLLGCPLLSAAWLLLPLLTAIHLPSLFAFAEALSSDILCISLYVRLTILSVLNFSGFLLTVSGSAIGIWNAKAKPTDRYALGLLAPFLFFIYWLIVTVVSTPTP